MGGEGLHHRRSFNPQEAKRPSHLPLSHHCRGQQERLPRRVGLMQNMMPMIKIVELLRELKRILRQVSRLGGRKTLLDDQRQLRG